MRFVFLVLIFFAILSCKNGNKTTTKSKETTNFNPRFLNKFDDTSTYSEEIDTSQIESLICHYDEIVQYIILIDSSQNKHEYIIDEPSLDAIYQRDKKCILTVLPQVMKKYSDLEMHNKILLSCYLYKSGNRKYLHEVMKQIKTNEDKEILKTDLQNFQINE